MYYVLLMIQMSATRQYSLYSCYPVIHLVINLLIVEQGCSKW